MAKSSIHELPEDLLHRILSLLPTIDAVRTSLVSPKWRYLWHGIRTLNFDLSIYESIPNSSSLELPDLIKSSDHSRSIFAEFITQTLLTRPKSTPIETFRLVFNCRRIFTTVIRIDSWIRHAVASGAAVLRLSFLEEPDGDSDDSDTFHRYVFRFSDLDRGCSEVRVLELSNCDIFWPDVISTDGFGFSTLSSISLHDVYIHGVDLSAMVSSCINLEFLSLLYLNQFQNSKTKIHSQSLKELELGFTMEHVAQTGYFEIWAPNLSKISFNCFSMGEYCSKDLSSLVEARVKFDDRSGNHFDRWCSVMILLRGIERLTVQNMWLNRDFSPKVLGANNISKCPPFKNLKHLELLTGYDERDLFGIATFLEQCPNLETLVLDHHYETEGVLSEKFKSEQLNLHIPSLKQVKMKSYKGTKKELYFVELLKMHKVVLRKIVAFPLKVAGELLPPLVLF